jgi:hypothetical protein
MTSRRRARWGWHAFHRDIVAVNRRKVALFVPVLYTEIKSNPVDRRDLQLLLLFAYERPPGRLGQAGFVPAAAAAERTHLGHCAARAARLVSNLQRRLLSYHPADAARTTLQKDSANYRGCRSRCRHNSRVRRRRRFPCIRRSREYSWNWRPGRRRSRGWRKVRLGAARPARRRSRRNIRSAAKNTAQRRQDQYDQRQGRRKTQPGCSPCSSPARVSGSFPLACPARKSARLRLACRPAHVTASRCSGYFSYSRRSTISRSLAMARQISPKVL